MPVEDTEIGRYGRNVAIGFAAGYLLKSSGLSVMESADSPVFWGLAFSVLALGYTAYQLNFKKKHRPEHPKKLTNPITDFSQR